MRTALFALALVAGGCGHFHPTAEYTEASAEVPRIGSTHTPYRGKPAYLASARPLQPVARPQAPASDNPCAQRSRTCDDRLRALLAAVDAEVLALSTPPTESEVEALRLTLVDLPSLLAPYTDVTAEGDELAVAVCKLPEATPRERGPLTPRMHELIDLIRVQLAAAQ